MKRAMVRVFCENIPVGIEQNLCQMTRRKLRISLEWFSDPATGLSMNSTVRLKLTVFGAENRKPTPEVDDEYRGSDHPD